MRNRFQEFEMIEHAGFCAADLARNDQRGRLFVGILELRVSLHVSCLRQFDAVKPMQEIDVPPIAAKFTISYGLEANRFLQSHDLADAFVFNRAQCGGFYVAVLRFESRLVQLRCTQEAANVVSAEGRHSAQFYRD